MHNHHATANRAWYDALNDTPGRVGPPIEKHRLGRRRLGSVSAQANSNRISLLYGTTTCDPHSLREWPFCGYVADPMGILWARLGPILGQRAVIQRPDSGLTHCEIGG